MRKIILNMDTGIDDALALLMMADRGDLEILGIVTTAGNVDVDKTTRNTLKILELIGRKDIPVYRGVGGPLVKNLVTSEEIHGRDGLGDSGFGEPIYRERKMYGPKFIAEALESGSGITIISTGPLTNIAISYLYDPESFRNLDRLIIMGGMYGLTEYSIGNISPYAEYNLFIDPEAFSILYRSGVDITTIGLDVTQNPKTFLDRKLLNRFLEINSVKSRIAYRITRRIIDSRGFFELHDPIAASYIIDPHIFRFKDLYVSISLDEGYSRGYIYVFKTAPKNHHNFGRVKAAYSIDADRFIEIFLNSLQ